MINNNINNLINEIKLNKLKYIDFRQKGLKNIPPKLLNLDFIEYLDLSHINLVSQDNGLKDIKFWKIKNNNNNFKYIDKNLSKLENLKVLKINQVGLKNIPETIFNLKNLEVLELENNFIQFIPRNIYKLKNLRVLKLSYNNIIDLPDELFELKNLEKLYLSNNNIGKIPSNIAKLKKIKEIDFSNTSNYLLSQDTIKYYDIRNNNIKKIEKAVLKLNNLEKLGLSNNNIEAIPFDYYQIFLLKKFIIKGNPLLIPPYRVIKEGVIEIYNYYKNGYEKDIKNHMNTVVNSFQLVAKNDIYKILNKLIEQTKNKLRSIEVLNNKKIEVDLAKTKVINFLNIPFVKKNDLAKIIKSIEQVILKIDYIINNKDNNSSINVKYSFSSLEELFSISRKKIGVYSCSGHKIYLEVFNRNTKNIEDDETIYREFAILLKKELKLRDLEFDYIGDLKYLKSTKNRSQAITIVSQITNWEFSLTFTKQLYLSNYKEIKNLKKITSRYGIAFKFLRGIENIKLLENSLNSFHIFDIKENIIMNKVDLLEVENELAIGINNYIERHDFKKFEKQNTFDYVLILDFVDLNQSNLNSNGIYFLGKNYLTNGFLLEKNNKIFQIEFYIDAKNYLNIKKLNEL